MAPHLIPVDWVTNHFTSGPSLRNGWYIPCTPRGTGATVVPSSCPCILWGNAKGLIEGKLLHMFGPLRRLRLQLCQLIYMRGGTRFYLFHLLGRENHPSHLQVVYRSSLHAPYRVPPHTQQSRCWISSLNALHCPTRPSITASLQRPPRLLGSSLSSLI